MKKIMCIITFTLILISFSGIILAENNSLNNSQNSSLSITGTIKFVDLEGGCWKIIASNGENYEPTNLEEAYKQDGLEVKFEGIIRNDMASICQVGTLIEITKIENKSDENETPVLGADCGTVTPGYQNECCENKGYDRWDDEEFECIREREQNGSLIQERNKIRVNSQNQTQCPENCTCSGSTVKCEFEGGRTMTVYAGNSGNVIVQIKGINASTNVTLYKEDGKVYGNFTGNKTKEIILPDEIMDKLRERHQKRLQLYNESINLTEDGYYQIQTKKKARLFWLVPVKENMKAQVNAETGEVIRIRNPWWGFLARDIRE